MRSPDPICISSKMFRGEPNLIGRIKKYLQQNVNASYLDAEILADALREIYPRDYKRKKRNAFIKTVGLAYDFVLQNEPMFLPKSANADFTQSRRDESPSSESEFSADNENYVEVEDANIVNIALQNLYKREEKANGDVPTTEKRKLAEETPKKQQRIKKRKSDPLSLKKKKDKILTVMDPYRVHTSVTTDDVAGCEKELQEINEIVRSFIRAKFYDDGDKPPSVGLLLHGPPGSGKTLLVHAVAGELDIPFFKVCATELVSGVSGESEERIRDLFARATAHPQSILFIDKIDAICAKKETAQKDMDRRISAQLVACMDALSEKDANAQVLVIGATNRPDFLDPALRMGGRFGHEIGLRFPDEKTRFKMLETFCTKRLLRENCDLKSLARNTPGFVGADLKFLVAVARDFSLDRIINLTLDSSQMVENDAENKIPDREAVRRSFSQRRYENSLTKEELGTHEFWIEQDDLEMALKKVKPCVKREGFATIPDVTWDNVGALRDIRDELDQSILATIRHPERYEKFGLTTPTGILFFGPPGCGKTLLAKAIANENDINFISVQGPELFNMYVGESEHAVRRCFKRARYSSPCIIFFDEIESLCTRRSETESNSGDRVVTQLLTEMDGLGDRRNVFIIGATNRPDKIDPAMLRPGRFDKILYVGVPSQADRVDILRALTKNGTKPPLAKDVSLTELGRDERCDGFTGADLSALVKEASSMAAYDFAVEEVSHYHFEAAFQKIRPSVSSKERKHYEKMQRHFSKLGKKQIALNANDPEGQKT